MGGIMDAIEPIKVLVSLVTAVAAIWPHIERLIVSFKKTLGKAKIRL